MIEIGNIVFKKYPGAGFRKERIDYASIGLVLERNESKYRPPQYKVAFHNHPPAWFDVRTST